MTDRSRDLDTSGSYRRIDPAGQKLVWALIAFFGLVAAGYFAWLGSSVVQMEADVASLKVEMKMVLRQKSDETAQVVP